MMEPPQNQASSMKRATCQGQACSVASIPQVALGCPRSFLLDGEAEALISAATRLIFSIRSSPLASTLAALGLYLLRSRPCAGLQSSAGRSLRPSGAALAIAQSAATMRNLMLV